jgi:hypothetical protein
MRNVAKKESSQVPIRSSHRNLSECCRPRLGVAQLCCCASARIHEGTFTQQIPECASAADPQTLRVSLGFGAAPPLSSQMCCSCLQQFGARTDGRRQCVRSQNHLWSCALSRVQHALLRNAKSAPIWGTSPPVKELGNPKQTVLDKLRRRQAPKSARSELASKATQQMDEGQPATSVCGELAGMEVDDVRADGVEEIARV